VKNLAADTARLRLGYLDTDGVTEVPTDSGDTAGIGSWSFLDFAGHHIPTWARGIYLEVVSLSGASDFLVDGAALVRGLVAPPETPHAQAVSCLAGHGHNLWSCGQSLELYGSDDNFASSTLISSVTPSSDKSFWDDFDSVSYRAYRFRLPGGEGSGLPSLAVLFLGTDLELPRCPRLGWDPYYRKLTARASISNEQAPMGRAIDPAPKRLRLENRNLTEAFIAGPLTNFWAHAGDGGNPGGLPFFLSWDSGEHPDQVFFCWYPGGAEFSAPLKLGLKADMAMDFLAACE